VFDHLEANDIEYTVRLSVVELYNEELSDLIAAAEDEGKGVLRKLRSTKPKASTLDSK
jgi:hypothetical protein